MKSPLYIAWQRVHKCTSQYTVTHPAQQEREFLQFRQVYLHGFAILQVPLDGLFVHHEQIHSISKGCNEGSLYPQAMGSLVFDAHPAVVETVTRMKYLPHMVVTTRMKYFPYKGAQKKMPTPACWYCDQERV